MNVTHASNAPRIRLRKGWWVLAAVGGAALAVAAAAVIGNWSDANTSSRTLETDDAAAQRPGGAGVAAGPSRQARSADRSHMVYLVTTQEEAVRLNQILKQVGGFEPETNGLSAATAVVALSSNEETSLFWEQIDTLHDWQHSLGVPLAKVIDLRPQ